MTISEKKGHHLAIGFKHPTNANDITSIMPHWLLAGVPQRKEC
jgi:hypothetical protein